MSVAETDFRLLYAGGYEGEIITLKFSPTNPPKLERVASSNKAGKAPTWLTLSDDGKQLCEQPLMLHVRAISVRELISTSLP